MNILAPYMDPWYIKELMGENITNVHYVHNPACTQTSSCIYLKFPKSLDADILKCACQIQAA